MMSATASSDLAPSAHHVFVDFENIHQVDLSLIGRKSVSFTLLVGARQTRLDAALVERLMEHAASVQLVRLTSTGRNALDFTLAYYLGRAVLADPAAHFHVISKDAGFDPLIEHMRSRRVHIRRHDDFTALPFARVITPTTTTNDAQLSRVRDHLRKNTENRPKRLKTLKSHLLAFLGKTQSEADVTLLIEELREAGDLVLGEKGEVTYNV